MKRKWPDIWFLLTWKMLLLIPAAWILCVILHNLIYALFQPFFEPGGDEPFFFVLAVVVIPLYTVVCLVYSLVQLGMKFAARSKST